MIPMRPAKYCMSFATTVLAGSTVDAYVATSLQVCIDVMQTGAIVNNQKIIFVE